MDDSQKTDFTSGKVVSLGKYRNLQTLKEGVGEEFLRALLSLAEDSEKTEEYQVFLSAIKALSDSREDKEGTHLNMKVTFDKEKESLEFLFKFC